MKYVKNEDNYYRLIALILPVAKDLWIIACLPFFFQRRYYDPMNGKIIPVD